MSIDVTVRAGESRESMKGGFGMLFTAYAVDACRKEASEKFMADASRCRVPVDESRVRQLFSKGGRPGRLYSAEDGSHREAFGFCQITIGICVRRALAG